MVFSIIFTQSKSCSSVMTKGGASLIIFPWVGLARSPFSFSCKQMFHAVELSGVSLIKIAFSSPLPLTLVISSVFSISFSISERNNFPSSSALSDSFSSCTTCLNTAFFRVEWFHHSLRNKCPSDFRFLSRY